MFTALSHYIHSANNINELLKHEFIIKLFTKKKKHVSLRKLK